MLGIFPSTTFGGPPPPLAMGRILGGGACLFDDLMGFPPD